MITAAKIQNFFETHSISPHFFYMFIKVGRRSIPVCRLRPIPYRLPVAQGLDYSSFCCSQSSISWRAMEPGAGGCGIFWRVNQPPPLSSSLWSAMSPPS